MFFEAALKGKNQIWRYLVMFIIVFASTNIIGGIPLIAIIILNTFKNPGAFEGVSDNLAQYELQQG